MKRIRRDTIRKLYRDGILQEFGCGDKDLDAPLSEAIRSEIHLAGRGPGEWVDQGEVLEIYCESGIPNASDIEDFYSEYKEFGIPIPPEGCTVYNCDRWIKIDDYVNLGIRGLGYSDRVHHEPFNGAVIGVYWS